MKTEIKGKRPAPNGMYWGSILIGEKYKLVMVQPLNAEIYRAYSNKKSLKNELDWTASKERKGWFYKDSTYDNFNIFDW